MALPASPLLDPAVLARVKDLRLVARTLVDGAVTGLHRQPRAGIGVELEQFRGYQPGDDPRRIDWRAHARSDRLIVRESPVERDVTVRLVVDATASMAHVDEATRARGAGGSVAGEATVSKLGYARMLAAALAFLALRQGDAVALHLVGSSAVDLPPLRRRRALERLLFHLQTMEAGGKWPSWAQLGPRLLRPRRREVVVVISDLWENEREIAAALAGLRALRHEVVLLHLIGRNELDFGWSGDLLFEDLESGAVVAGDAGSLRDGYLRRLAAWLEAWQRRAAELGVTYQRVPLDRPLELALRDVLARRRRLR
ncbi:MAG TPA: DUF58 domain-containing protein [Thermoanaerobaculia bacterium]|nr:DUF58 domain-containing protein [Thermoanaerobaculia bacterium]